MPLKPPAPKRGEKRKITLTMVGSMTERQFRNIVKRVNALLRNPKLKATWKRTRKRPL